MKILVLGGTGAIGNSIVSSLAESNNLVIVTSRKHRESTSNIKYIKGDAKNDIFFNTLMKEKYDVIIDFMVYNTKEFARRKELLLKNTKQYIFFSSCRVYADSKKPINENSPRLLDVIDDMEYLATDEYALSKAREEDILINSTENNWTIIRPYITYNTNRFQLGVFEKENWLRRALYGRTIVFPRDIAEKHTTLTHGSDVAYSMLKLIGNDNVLGETFHIVTNESITWDEVLMYYLDIIKKKTGRSPKVKYIDNSSAMYDVWNKWQIKYDRLCNRIFDNSKIEGINDSYEYKKAIYGLEECLNDFLDKPIWLDINWKFEALCDKITGEFTPLKEIPEIKMKLKYLIWRFIKL